MYIYTYIYIYIHIYIYTIKCRVSTELHLWFVVWGTLSSTFVKLSGEVSIL